MRRIRPIAALLILGLLVILGPLGLGGCLRTRVDLCAQVPPHVECAYLDAGRDSPAADIPGDAPMDEPGLDSGIDAGALDAGESDRALDAGETD